MDEATRKAIEALEHADHVCETCIHERDSGTEYCGCCDDTTSCWTESQDAFDERMEKIRKVKGIPSHGALLHEYETTRGLWCIDRDPKDVDIDWIRANAFQLQKLEAD